MGNSTRASRQPSPPSAALGVPPRSADPAHEARRTPARLWRAARTTLRGQFIILALLIVLVALFHTWSSVRSFAQASTALETIGSASLPSVAAAQAMGQYMEDIDSYASDYLASNGLTEPETCAVMGTDHDPGTQTIHGCADINLDAESVVFNQQLAIAARNVAFAGEQTAIERITTGFQEYLDNLAVMRHEFGLTASKTDPSDPHLQAARAAYERANSVLHTKITRLPALGKDGQPMFDEMVPECVLNGTTVAGHVWPLGSVKDNLDCLSSINKTQLDTTYSTTMRQLRIAQIVAITLGVLLGGLLLAAVWRMLVVTHRVVNVGLTLALLGGGGYSAVTVARLITVSDSFTQALHAYDGVYATAILERYSTVANNDEAHWLIAVAFNDQTSATYWFGDWQKSSAFVQDYMQRAQANRVWPEEDASLVTMQQAWETYTTLDTQMRALATDTRNPNRALDAERLGVGDSDAAYTTFADAVDRLNTIKHDHFTQLYDQTLATLRQSLLLSVILFPLAGLLGAWGIYRRLRDF